MLPTKAWWLKRPANWTNSQQLKNKALLGDLQRYLSAVVLASAVSNEGSYGTFASWPRERFNLTEELKPPFADMRTCLRQYSHVPCVEAWKELNIGRLVITRVATVEDGLHAPLASVRGPCGVGTGAIPNRGSNGEVLNVSSKLVRPGHVCYAFAHGS